MASKITKAAAWCNGEVAYLAWDIAETIDGCLGFMITRVHETGSDAGVRRCLPSWIAFTDQSNPNWVPQDTSVWPIQNFEWRDLTLRRSRDTTNVRPIDFRVHYEIVPVGTAGRGRVAVPPSPTAVLKDADGKPNYTGTPRPLFMIGDPFVTKPIDVTHRYTGPRGAVEATFTNGILSTQNLLLQLRQAIAAHGHAPAKGHEPKKGSLDSTAGLLAELKNQIADPKSEIRAFLTADVLSFLRRFLDEADKDDAEVFLALYELHDPELIALLKTVAGQKRIHLILSTAGQAKPPKGSHQPVVWDTENNDARAALHAIAPDRVFDRMFNNALPIGHDKFAVYVKGGKAQKVLTGSTNWTETGLCTQSNNSLIISDPKIAGFYLDFWNRLLADKQPARVPATTTDGHGKTIAGAEPNHAIQGTTLRRGNSHPFGPTKLADGSQATAWFSPNTATAKKTPDSPMPPDLNDVYSLMDHAKEAIFFLTFMPGVAGQQNIIGEAAKLAADRPDLLVVGAISDPSAMPNAVRAKPGAPKPKVKIPPPSVWWPDGEDSRIAMIRATAISTPIGDLHPELLSAGHAIIHDKIIVIDPLDAENCAVITGSHNLGYKASYDNDENLLIIKGNLGLAASYAVHVLDIYQHYLMRAKQEETIRAALLKGKPPAQATVNHGFLMTKGDWQERFFGEQPLSAMSYFLSHV